MSLWQEGRKGSKRTEQLTGQQIAFYTLLVCSTSLKIFSLVFTSNQARMCSAKLFICKPFPELVEARTLCMNLLFPEKGVLSEEEIHQTEQTLVSPEVKLSQWVTVKSRGCFCIFFPRLATFLTNSPTKAAALWQSYVHLYGNINYFQYRFLKYKPWGEGKCICNTPKDNISFNIKGAAAIGSVWST